MSNPIGSDGFPMENHHPARQAGPTELIPKCVHDIIHQNERDAVRDIMQQDGLAGHPGRWTAKHIQDLSGT
jgi:hypothetical protein